MSKYSAEIKISACKEYLTRTISHEDICKKYGIPLYRRKNDSMIKEWLPYYLEYGEGAFAKNKGNNNYSSEIKKQAVEDYIYGNGSIRDICIKYQIPSTKTLRQWIQVYNANRELKGYDPKREVYMAEAKRKTTLAVIRKKKKKYLSSIPQAVAENILQRDFYATGPNQKWATDVTEFKVPSEKKKLYLSAIIDLYDRYPVAYVISCRNDNRLVFKTFDKAIATNPDAKPIFNSDRGFQYTSKVFQENLITKKCSNPCPG